MAHGLFESLKWQEYFGLIIMLFLSGYSENLTPASDKELVQTSLSLQVLYLLGIYQCLSSVGFIQILSIKEDLSKRIKYLFVFF